MPDSEKQEKTKATDKRKLMRNNSKGDLADMVRALERALGKDEEEIKGLNIEIAGLKSAAVEMDSERIRELTVDLKSTTQRLENAYDESRHYQTTNSSLHQRLQAEMKAHEETRQRVKNPPRFKIDSNALLDMSKNGRDSDSNLSLQFGNCDVTVTAPPKKETRRPDECEGVKYINFLLDQETDPIREDETMDTVASLMTVAFMTALKTGKPVHCPFCGDEDEDCGVTRMLRGKAFIDDCIYDGPSDECDACPYDHCVYNEMPVYLRKMMLGRSTDAFGSGTSFGLLDLIIQMGGSAMTIPHRETHIFSASRLRRDKGY